MRTKIVASVAGVLLVLICVVVWKYPFRREAMVKRVQADTGAKVEVGRYRETWFPPGFSAERVRLTDPKGNEATIATIQLEAGYTGRIHHLRARGVRVNIPSMNALPQRMGKGSSTLVGEVRLDDVVLQVESFQMPVHSLVLTNVGKDQEIGFQVALHNPEPAGEVHAHGQFKGTDLTGAFTFEHADLSVEHGITAATLNASGRFSGPLRALKCTGTADLPVFQVAGSSHPVHIASAFDVIVDALHGDVVMNQVLAHFNGTTVSASGKVADKQVTVDTAVHEGRVEDLLLLFTKKPNASMQGPITLRARFIIPPGPPGFLTRLKMDGDFTITRGHFTNPKAQVPIDRLSASGRGEAKQEQRDYPTLTVADIHGAVVTRQQGVATLRTVTFEAPGLSGQLAGTFGLRDKSLRLAGQFETKGNMADTTSGVKSFALKVMGPLWPRKHSVQTVPFRVTGTAGHPVFSIQFP